MPPTCAWLGATLGLSRTPSSLEISGARTPKDGQWQLRLQQQTVSAQTLLNSPVIRFR